MRRTTTETGFVDTGVKVNVCSAVVPLCQALGTTLQVKITELRPLGADLQSDGEDGMGTVGEPFCVERVIVNFASDTVFDTAL